jgi:CBS domain-containing protein
MTPAYKLKVAHTDQDLLSVLQELNAENADHIPVVEARRAIGIINREDMARFIHARAEFGTGSAPK